MEPIIWKSHSNSAKVYLIIRALQDTIQTFYDITHQEVKTLELKTSAKDREMELMEDNHR